MSKRLLGYACELALEHAAKVDLLHVVEPIHDIRDFGYGAVKRTRPNAFAMARANVRLRALAGRYLEPVGSWRIAVRSGARCEEIVKAAEELNSGLIIVATHGHLPLRQIRAPGVAARVISRTPCPVLVVRTPLLTQPTSGHQTNVLDSNA